MGAGLYILISVSKLDEAEAQLSKGMQSIKSAFNKATPKSTSSQKLPSSASVKNVSVMDFFGKTDVHRVERKVIPPSKRKVVSINSFSLYKYLIT